jgi:hypothetical protein
MSTTLQQRPGAPTPQANGEQAKPKRSRSPSAPRPAYIVVQVTDEQGQPQQFDKRRMKVIGVHREADKVLELVEAGDHPNAFYLRVIVPGGSRAGSPNKPKD